MIINNATVCVKQITNMAASTKIKSSETSDKKRRAMAFHVLCRVGIVKGHYDGLTVGCLDIARLNSISDHELLRTRGCGPVILRTIHQLRQNINDAILLII